MSRDFYPVISPSGRIGHAGYMPVKRVCSINDARLAIGPTPLDKGLDIASLVRMPEHIKAVGAGHTDIPRRAVGLSAVARRPGSGFAHPVDAALHGA